LTAAAGGSLTGAAIAAMGAYGIWQEWWIGTLWFSVFYILVMARYVGGSDLPHDRSAAVHQRRLL